MVGEIQSKDFERKSIISNNFNNKFELGLINSHHTDLKTF